MDYKSKGFTFYIEYIAFLCDYLIPLTIVKVCLENRKFDYQNLSKLMKDVMMYPINELKHYPTLPRFNSSIIYKNYQSKYNFYQSAKYWLSKRKNLNDDIANMIIDFCINSDIKTITPKGINLNLTIQSLF